MLGQQRKRVHILATKIMNPNVCLSQMATV